VIPLHATDDLSAWVERTFGHVFASPELLDAALTHRSAGADHNERLEFLGDSILNCSVARMLYDAHPQADEGALSRLRATLVSGESLAQIAGDLGLGEHLHLGAGELKSGGFRRASILADALEALLGAIFLDSGFDAADAAVARIMTPRMSDLPGAEALKDPKTRLQEVLQASGPNFRAGHVAIVGRPNVGKSTLVNALVGRKVTIVTAKPQTTRHRILGLVNRREAQLVLVDTPGLHESTRRVMNQYMNRVAISSSQDADVVLFVIEAMRFTDEDIWVWERVRGLKQPLFLVVNKVDRVFPKEQLLPFLEDMAQRVPASGIIPVSALQSDNLERLVDLVGARLPVSPPLFGLDVVTDRDEPFHAAEIVREKLTLKLREELPYGINVQIERFADEDNRIMINAVIWVERAGQKAIVIGQGGERLKEIGRLARIELNDLWQRSVHLELWVKVKENWADSEMALRQFGYDTL
jgi:GTP-binding protein Era